MSKSKKHDAKRKEIQQIVRAGNKLVGQAVETYFTQTPAIYKIRKRAFDFWCLNLGGEHHSLMMYFRSHFRRSFCEREVQENRIAGRCCITGELLTARECREILQNKQIELERLMQ